MSGQLSVGLRDGKQISEQRSDRPGARARDDWSCVTEAPIAVATALDDHFAAIPAPSDDVTRQCGFDCHEAAARKTSQVQLLRVTRLRIPHVTRHYLAAISRRSAFHVPCCLRPITPCVTYSPMMVLLFTTP